MTKVVSEKKQKHMSWSLAQRLQKLKSVKEVVYESIKQLKSIVNCQRCTFFFNDPAAHVLWCPALHDFGVEEISDMNHKGFIVAYDPEDLEDADTKRQKRQGIIAHVAQTGRPRISNDP